MPRYRTSIWSASKPNVRQTKIISTRSVKDAINKTTFAAVQLQLRGHLADDDIMWSVERLSGHLGSWVIAAHSRNRKSDHATA